MATRPIETTNLQVRVSLPVMLLAVVAVVIAALVYALVKF
jgi:hypothetical protein